MFLFCISDEILSELKLVICTDTLKTCDVRYRRNDIIKRQVVSLGGRSWPFGVSTHVWNLLAGRNHDPTGPDAPWLNRIDVNDIVLNFRPGGVGGHE